MASKKAIGAYYENKAKKMLEAEGYIVERALPKTVWIPGKGGRRPISIHHDFFGLFDLIAIKEKEVRWIQIKFLGKGSEGRTRPNILEEIRKFPGDGELWIFRQKAKLPEVRK